ncbi:MAG: hypothetical protein IPK04_15895 [Bdellovibrionales bacterium]|nr:hypothetical protein [Bdellovibrionales bacterium]
MDWSGLTPKEIRAGFGSIDDMPEAALAFILEQHKNVMPKLIKPILRGWSSSQHQKYASWYKQLGPYFNKIANISVNVENLGDRKELESIAKQFCNELSKNNSIWTVLTQKGLRPKWEITQILAGYMLKHFQSQSEVLLREIELLASHSSGFENLFPSFTRRQAPYSSALAQAIVISAILENLVSEPTANGRDKIVSMLDGLRTLDFIGDLRATPPTNFWKEVLQIVSPRAIENWRTILNEEDIAFFFDNIEVDPARKDFWLKYKTAAERTFVILDHEKHSALLQHFGGDEELTNIIKRARIYRSQKVTYYSIVLVFGGIVAVEAHKTGQACFLFERSNFDKLFPFFSTSNDNNIPLYNSDPFKDKKDEKFNHTHAWQNIAKKQLEQHQVFQNESQNIQQAYRRQAAKKNLDEFRSLDSEVGKFENDNAHLGNSNPPESELNDSKISLSAAMCEQLLRWNDLTKKMSNSFDRMLINAVKTYQFELSVNRKPKMKPFGR